MSPAFEVTFTIAHAAFHFDSSIVFVDVVVVVAGPLSWCRLACFVNVALNFFIIFSSSTRFFYKKLASSSTSTHRPPLTVRSIVRLSSPRVRMI
jgi:hypothetical protein